MPDNPADWVCGYCDAPVKEEDKSCSRCGKDVSVNNPPVTWTCIWCNFEENPNGTYECSSCGSQRDIIPNPEVAEDVHELEVISESNLQGPGKMDDFDTGIFKDRWKCPKCGGIYRNTIKTCFGCSQSELRQAKTISNASVALNDCYRTLGLQPDALLEEVKRAYKELSTVWDPARYDNDPSLQGRAVTMLKEIDKAYGHILLSHSIGIQQPMQTQHTVSPKGSVGSQSSETKPEGNRKIVQRVKDKAAETVNVKERTNTAKRSFFIATMMTIVVVFLNASFGDKKPHNMFWTWVWIYLTAEIWKYWGWRALIPYPAYIVFGSVLAVIVAQNSAGNSSPQIAMVIANIIGIVIFYIVLREARKVESVSDSKPPLAQAVAQAESTGWVCDKCEKPLKHEDKWCSHCGADVNEIAR